MSTTDKVNATPAEPRDTVTPTPQRRGVWSRIKGFFAAWMDVYGGCACKSDRCETDTSDERRGG